MRVQTANMLPGAGARKACPWDQYLPSKEPSRQLDLSTNATAALKALLVIQGNQNIFMWIFFFLELIIQIKKKKMLVDTTSIQELSVWKHIPAQ